MSTPTKTPDRAQPVTAVNTDATEVPEPAAVVNRYPITGAVLLVWLQALGFMLCGVGPVPLYTTGFALPVSLLIAWICGNLLDGVLLSYPATLFIGVAFAVVVHRWVRRADHRARIAVVTATVLAATLAIASAIWWAMTDRDWIAAPLYAVLPYLAVQAVILRCLYGPAGRRWFTRGVAGSTSSFDTAPTEGRE